ncbi:MAG: putative L-ornithine-N5-monooxygenase [Lentinula lateritia]|uniref:L-ornithine N(5)-monooxygenase [NAD(P)H] n=1 Tax=Lentinula lateritia TaxID=40482 RepID=A0ABQ8VS03_9AGAR|nr:MAG: putative L-ornithine-N5-monooxygenase [Lentinula lateritia]KAJ4499132.1 L-lysine 6-monooxygenase (NADPH-requiring)-domain-containing protein [Lentinula lateritia]
MSTGTESTYPAVYDLIGIGFGPSNIAISGALVEKWTALSNDAETSFQKVLFIERHPSFQWHPGMLLPGAQMQISFMKDLATLRSPQSPLTFVNYLHSQGRLSAFINRGSLTPSRKEFADYLEWAARYVEAQGVNVNYGQEVVAIDESMDGLITVTSITLADGKLNSFITRNLVVSPGGRARIPNVVVPFIKEPSIVARSTLLHSSEYKHRIGELLESITSERQRPLRIAVIGGGQSAAEVTMNLHGLLNDLPAGDGPIGHQVDMLLRKGSLKPSDDTPFSNEIFDPEVTNDWFSTSEQGRERIMAEYKATNYSVVNPRTIDALYEMIYDQEVDEAIGARNSTVFTPRPRITIRSHMHIPSLKYDTGSKNFVFTLQNVRTREVFENESYDAVVCATGYQRNSWTKMFRASDRLGKRFGIDDSASDIPIKLVPFAQRVADTADLDQPQDSPLSSVSSTPTSVVTTPPISPGAENVVKQESSPTEAVKLYITRNYRLLPMASTKTMQDGSAEGLKARIYIQGLEESTHGLSDTLLSVVSCRAGEVVDDLLNND